MYTLKDHITNMVNYKKNTNNCGPFIPVCTPGTNIVQTAAVISTHALTYVV